MSRQARIDELKKLKETYDDAQLRAKTEILAYGPIEYLEVLIEARINDLEFSNSVPPEYPIVSSHNKGELYEMKTTPANPVEKGGDLSG